MNWDSSYLRWTRTQHEVSHLFGAPDRYNAYAEIHPDDVMEKSWQDPDYWCTNDDFNDWGIVWSNRAKYD